MSDLADFGTSEQPAGDPGTTPEQLRRFFPPEQPLEADPREAADRVLSRAARTVEKLLSEIKASQDEIARLDSSRPDLEDQRMQRRSAEEVVGEALLTAHRAADSLLEKARQDAAWMTAEARRETLPLLAEAQRTLEEAGMLHRNAQATIAQARLHADAVVESARAERQRLIADALSDAEQRRAELELDNLRLETAIKNLRSEWAGRAAEALARLDRIALEQGPPKDVLQDVDADARREETEIGADESGGFLGDEVIRDLHARLPESEPAEPSPRDRLS